RTGSATGRCGAGDRRRSRQAGVEPPDQRAQTSPQAAGSAQAADQGKRPNRPIMNRQPRQNTTSRCIPGMGLMLALIASFIIVMGAMKMARPVRWSEAGSAHAAWPDMRINVNTAAAAELQLLPGIGERLAERIVAERDARGPFAT